MINWELIAWFIGMAFLASIITNGIDAILKNKYNKRK